MRCLLCIRMCRSRGKDHEDDILQDMDPFGEEELLDVHGKEGGGGNK